MLKDSYMAGVREAGCDEAGRGCLAGPVYAAAVVTGPGFDVTGLTDSKKLSEGQRYRLRGIIIERAEAWAVASADNEEIDRVNILNATMLAMNRAIARLPDKPDHLVIDGNCFRGTAGIPFHTVVHGDAKYKSVAAASILAKTFRDDYMRQIHLDHRYFGWDRNKGYPTRQHREAIRKYGFSDYHRTTFRF